jgi:hypothetical protein
VRRNSIAGAIALLAAGCAAKSTPVDVQIPLPTTSEVQTFVRENWKDWYWRFANIAGHRGEDVSLESLGPVSCRYHYFTPECTVEVTGRLADGTSKTLPMFAQFERNKSGALEEVLVLYEERREPRP